MSFKEVDTMSEEDFAGKVEWEGGVLDALDYGLRSTAVVPGELRDAWARLEAKWDAMQDDMADVQEILEDLTGEEGGEA